MDINKRYQTMKNGEVLPDVRPTVVVDVVVFHTHQHREVIGILEITVTRRISMMLLQSQHRAGHLLGFDPLLELVNGHQRESVFLFHRWKN